MLQQIALVLVGLLANFAAASDVVIVEYFLKPGSESCFSEEYLFVKVSPDGSEIELQEIVDGQVIGLDGFRFQKINQGPFQTDFSTPTGRQVPVMESNLMIDRDDTTRLINQRTQFPNELIMGATLAFTSNTLTIETYGKLMNEKLCEYIETEN